MKYDALGRLNQWQQEFGSNGISEYTYKYNADGHIDDVLVNGKVMWHCETNSNGDVITVSQHGAVQSIGLNLAGQVQQFSDTTYNYDADGFVVRRGQQLLEWDARAQLTHCMNSGRDTEYIYDAAGRFATYQILGSPCHIAVQ